MEVKIWYTLVEVLAKNKLVRCAHSCVFSQTSTRVHQILASTHNHEVTPYSFIEETTLNTKENDIKWAVISEHGLLLKFTDYDALLYIFVLSNYFRKYKNKTMFEKVKLNMQTNSLHVLCPNVLSFLLGHFMAIFT